MIVEVYPGCRYCETGIIVTLHKLTYEEAKEWDWEPDIKFSPEPPSGLSQLNFPILGNEDLIEAAIQMGRDDDLIDFLRDEGLDLLQRALSIREKKLRT